MSLFACRAGRSTFFHWGDAMADCEISFDMSRMDFRATSDLLMASYWGVGRTDETHRRAFANSLCAAAYIGGRQVGFGRAITDRTVFAYLADIIVWPDCRGQGIGLRLVRALIEHPEVKTVAHWSLSTSMASTRSSVSSPRRTGATCGSTARRSNEPAPPAGLLQNRLSAWTSGAFAPRPSWRADMPSL